MQNNARIGGILSIVAGAFAVFYLLGLVFMVLVFSIASVESGFYYDGYGSPDGVFTAVMIFYIIFLGGFTLLGVLSVIGGIFALRRNNWGLALAGAIAGTIVFFPVGVPAIVFIALGKGEFEKAGPTALPVQ